MEPLIEAFFEYLTVERSLAAHTVEAYISDLESFSLYLQKDQKELLDSTSEDLLGYLAQLENPRTQNRRLSSINSFYSFAKENYDMGKLPKASFAKLPQNLPKYLEPLQIMQYLQLIDQSTILGLRDYAICIFLFASGVRVSELIGLKTQDINDNWVKIIYAKGAKQRMVPVAKVALDAVKKYLESRNDKSEYLFVNYLGKPISRISIFKITQKYFGVSPHVFRHSYATSLILGGADLMVVSELLGHSNVETTQIYTHLEQKHLQQTIQQHHPMSLKGID
ncbi:MAG: tyrosine-type recombinase/integrase [Campylobacterales bacterium]|nr:tyrosine-type recombinase/integrase [Campylobacterales bacterium]